MTRAEHSQLGRTTRYCNQYDPSLLFPIPRSEKRDELGIQAEALPFSGVDVWQAFEVSWLDAQGKPQVRLVCFEIPASSPNLIESKSFKLYLNSFNGTRFESEQAVTSLWQQDLSDVAGAPVGINVQSVSEPQTLIGGPEGICLDDEPVTIERYQVTPDLLKADDSTRVGETLYSHLLKSNCLVTGQPDWGSVVIDYTGPKIDRAALLQYLVSFREHNEFHEQCVERVFTDLKRHCQPEKLTVYARYVRRGGLDINPYRSDWQTEFDLRRWVRQ
jgi:7-cyano-7-deazaguanine reductase